MPELTFEITGVRPDDRGMVPLLSFDLTVRNEKADEYVQSVILQAQIRIEPVRRPYSSAEKERLVELFGAVHDWGRTLRDTLWTQVGITVPSFTGETRVSLAVPCTFDLNVAAAKYLFGLEEGEVPLIFLFSGTVFYAEDSRILIERVPWDKECRYRMPVEHWKSLMDHHYPNSAWMYLSRDVFECLYAYRRRNGMTSWDDAISDLLSAAENHEEQKGGAAA